jgi:hypothetical protein
MRAGAARHEQNELAVAACCILLGLIANFHYGLGVSWFWAHLFWVSSRLQSGNRRRGRLDGTLIWFGWEEGWSRVWLLI